MPDEEQAIPGTTEGADADDDSPDQRNDAGARDQGVESEESDDLSSPRFTVHVQRADGA